MTERLRRLWVAPAVLLIVGLSVSPVAAADKTKVDAMIPKATAVNTELAKPQVEPSKLTQLAAQLGDLQKQYASLRGN